MLKLEDVKLGVIGLGYVGLPLAVEFGKLLPTVGYDINEKRIHDLNDGIDHTLEVESELMKSASKLSFSCDLDALKNCNTYIVTVPTPIDSSARPDLTPLIRASEALGKIISKGDVVIYESTVYPGATEEDCIPIIEKVSGLTFNQDFFAGYSPERINPGDKEHRVTTIMKVTSGSTPEAADFVDTLYKRVIVAGTHKASSIKVAEAAKVIENTQRDLNIALMNELSIIFNRIGVDTEEVLKAAGTKWNFLPFRPGLVGGHCIGVDPYYLTHKAEQIGYHPQVILAGRRVNDGMGSYVAGQLVKKMIKERIHVEGARVLILGLTFKENCPDLRNTKVVDIIRELSDFNVEVDVFDPHAIQGEAEREYGVSLVDMPTEETYEAIVLAVAHDKFREMGINKIRRWGKPVSILYDLKCVFEKFEVELRL
ncbi:MULTISPECIES: Vi polysaccharide biosynthesis UDP-N-acetylglucosamine C-6 dehydrogenase TviB [unclassified Halomonas]|uniref:Vi polysaccharide biosynthesis UDP-N-acetylglucosamine C-6 dehydrogenase TviB n=1 Tax=unclassified Halomonas TaxID=2609666 RepID=UPI002884ED93|nr:MULTISPECIES: Vi polysaccharide biosynthesis UDP-N-acetylglucosamine C-6 dehydrogenase TviB [unclassified Halomonas]MDT0500572.1 Vi polysaccharide biosynthesis UDP-N-acetylglucosamine C-6 dehydrogenase TviB [Halomonas sp. PAR7]MDT0511532.1 Vi polysaccharide biosynthesis UDP-N-acetylglucosamine C-6 dehydrogenase TviB [Halomonas sp. LES1]MDT0590180.1 Vi polysaccharide biosynthesis UDP-N-acetylglucosamine C-6 dehydrogenase TviB [Halomonas sp. PAR8]